MNDLNITDEDFDKLSSGKPCTGGREMRDVARLIQQLKDAYVVAIPGSVEARHLAAIKRALPSTRPRLGAAAGAKPAGLTPLRLFNWKPDKPYLGRLSGSWTARSLSARAAAAATSIFIATGSLAAAGALPSPVQSAVSEAAGSIGLRLPSPQSGPSGRLAPGSGSAPSNSRASAKPEPGPAEQAVAASADQAIVAADNAQKIAREATARIAECLTGVQEQVAGISARLSRALDPAQAASLVSQAQLIGAGARQCADLASSESRKSAGQARLAELAAEAAGQTALKIQDAPDSARALEVARTAQDAAAAARSAAAVAMDSAQSALQKITGVTAGTVSRALGLQQGLGDGTGSARNPAAGRVPGTQPASVTGPSPPAPTDSGFRAALASRFMSSFTGGASGGNHPAGVSPGESPGGTTSHG